MAAKKPVADPLEDALATINTNYGAGSIVRLGDEPSVEVQRVGTGVWSLDVALGGGLPLGRMVECFGPVSSGKSTLAMHAVAEAQRNGGICAYIDAEHAMDPVYAKAIGVNIDDLLISQPDHAEQALEIVELLVRSHAVQVIVVDSVAALTPRAEMEGAFGDVHVGLQPRLMSQALRKLVSYVYDNNVLLIWINQLRESIGKSYGPTEYRPGGKAIPYYSSVIMDVRRIQTIKQGENAIANRTRIKVIKNKVGIPHKQCEFDLEYGKGIPREGVLLDMALECGVIKQSGSWLATANGESIGNGRVAAKLSISSTPELYESIRSAVAEKLEV